MKYSTVNHNIGSLLNEATVSHVFLLFLLLLDLYGYHLPAQYYSIDVALNSNIHLCSYHKAKLIINNKFVSVDLVIIEFSQCGHGILFFSFHKNVLNLLKLRIFLEQLY